jgi:hypothetical protein
MALKLGLSYQQINADDDVSEQLFQKNVYRKARVG